MFLESKSNKKDILTMAFLEELTQKKKEILKRTIKLETESNEIAEIISEKLLERVQREVMI